MYIDDADGTVQRRLFEVHRVSVLRASVSLWRAETYDEEFGQAIKCDACIELRANGEQPACVAACPMRALRVTHLLNSKRSTPMLYEQWPFCPSLQKRTPVPSLTLRVPLSDSDYVEVML